ncbi:MAG: hypothetical protein ACREUA_02500, partial [Burkholderiales bacterium]
VWGPHGNFVFAESQRQPIFVACDTGFAPLRSLIEHAMALDIAETLPLYWLATRTDGHFLANQCRAWAEALDQFRYVLHADPDPAAGARKLVQRMHTDLPLEQCDIYLAGPGEFIDTALDELRFAGAAQAQIFALVV